MYRNLFGRISEGGFLVPISCQFIHAISLCYSVIFVSDVLATSEFDFKLLLFSLLTILSFFVATIPMVIFHIVSVTLGGSAHFASYFKIGSIAYLFPAILMLIPIFLNVTISDGVFKSLGYSIFYTFNIIIIHHVYSLNILKSIISVVGPILSIYLMTEIFKSIL